MPEIDDNDYRIHLILGITGHRDIPQEDVDKLKEKIKEIFNELKGKYPHTPLLLLTPLAEGADRIAAKAAIEEGIDYAVVLPFPEEEYVKDFPETMDEYYDLRDKEKHKNLMGIFPLKDKMDDDAKKYGPERDKLYENVGAYIARHSQILIALWDGKEGKKGGTSEIVKFKLKGLPDEYHPHGDKLDKPDTGPVYIIYTRRKKSNSEDLKNYLKLEKKYPEDTNEGYFDEIFKRFDEFNRDSGKLNSKKIEQSRNELARDASDKEKFVSHIYANADALAIKYKIRWKFITAILIFLALLTTSLLIYYSITNYELSLLIYGSLFILFAVLFKFLNLFHEPHQKYVDYRGLAEGLRILFFMRLAGIHENVEDYYLKKHRINFRWGREIIRSANIFDPQPEPDFQTIREYWIKPENDYYKKNADENNRKLKIYKKLSLTFFSLSILIIIIAILLIFLNIGDHFIILIALIAIFPLVSGAFETYISRNAFTYNSKQYTIMKDIFERAEDKLRELGISNEENIKEKQSVIRELMKEAVRENADWMLMHIELEERIPL